MRLKRLLVSLALLFGVWSCAIQTGQGVKRSLLGVSNQQMLIDAQHVLAQGGIEVESVDVAAGEITSEWHTKNRKQLQYIIRVEEQPVAPAASVPPTDTDGTKQSATIGVSKVQVTVKVNVRKKTVSGWSEPVPGEDGKASDLADEIIALAVNRFEHGAVPLSPEEEEAEEEPKLVCENNAGCGAGLHCANGMCVAECDAAHPCVDSGRECDVRGRCVLKPEPCPTTQESSVDSELPYDMPKAKSKEKSEEEEAAERRKRRRERREREREREEEGQR